MIANETTHLLIPKDINVNEYRCLTAFNNDQNQYPIIRSMYEKPLNNMTQDGLKMYILHLYAKFEIFLKILKACVAMDANDSKSRKKNTFHIKAYGLMGFIHEIVDLLLHTSFNKCTLNKPVQHVKKKNMANGYKGRVPTSNRFMCKQIRTANSRKL